MNSRDKWRVAIDTNLIISAFITANTSPDKLLQAWKQDTYILLMTRKTLEELHSVSQRDMLKNKYKRIAEDLPKLLFALSSSAVFVEPVPIENLPVRCRDPKDDILLTTALGGNADYLVTGDNDLLALNGMPELGTLRIVNATAFLSLAS